jgi:hypothetical protein
VSALNKLIAIGDVLPGVDGQTIMATTGLEFADYEIESADEGSYTECEYYRDPVDGTAAVVITERCTYDPSEVLSWRVSRAVGAMRYMEADR